MYRRVFGMTELSACAGQQTGLMSIGSLALHRRHSGKAARDSLQIGSATIPEICTSLYSALNIGWYCIQPSYLYSAMTICGGSGFASAQLWSFTESQRSFALTTHIYFFTGQSVHSMVAGARAAHSFRACSCRPCWHRQSR